MTWLGIVEVGHLDISSPFEQLLLDLTG